MLARRVWAMTRDASASLLLRPGHTLGMISGVTVAVSSALASVVIADTQQAQVNLRFDLQRSAHVVVQAQSPTPRGFSEAGLERIAALDPVGAVGELSIWKPSARVSRSVPSPVVGAPLIVADPGGLRAAGATLQAGGTTGLLRGGGRFAWVGPQLAAELGVAPAVGGASSDSQILVEGVPFSVAGVLGDTDRGFGYLGRAVVVSRPAARRALGGNGTNVRLLAQVRPGSAQAVADYAVLAADPFAELTLTDATPPDGRRLLGNVGADLRLIGAALGGFIGLVGLIAVANTLMMSVHQRRRELGLRSAMGWSRTRVGLLVLTESGAAGLVAGILGSALGLGCASVWCWSHGWTLVMPPLLPLLVLAGGTVASLVGGVIPAFRAASTSPLTAMRS
ncbi:MAG: ABC transporter permease [Propionibacteriales bacterium]|nr:ABC transporter permease [Propionibacteriales bacterium]